MARPLRIQYPNAMYHIISRSIGRMTIFHNEKDWKKFIQFLDRVIERYNWKYQRIGSVFQGRYKAWLVERVGIKLVESENRGRI